jgi:hypothetical protein
LCMMVLLLLLLLLLLSESLTSHFLLILPWFLHLGQVASLLAREVCRYSDAIIRTMQHSSRIVFAPWLPTGDFRVGAKGESTQDGKERGKSESVFSSFYFARSARSW